MWGKDKQSVWGNEWVLVDRNGNVCTTLEKLYICVEKDEDGCIMHKIGSKESCETMQKKILLVFPEADVELIDASDAFHEDVVRVQECSALPYKYFERLKSLTVDGYSQIIDVKELKDES